MASAASSGLKLLTFSENKLGWEIEIIGPLSSASFGSIDFHLSLLSGGMCQAL